MQDGGKRVLGYARVSSRGQCLDRQYDALEKRGIPKRDIYVDKASGKNFERPEYLRLKQQLQAGDTLVVLDLDRIGRNYSEIAAEWHDITMDKQCEIEVINFPLLNTAEKHSALEGKLIANLVFNVLSYVAEKERQEIHQRQREGIDSAKKNGVRFGRPHIKRPENFDEVYGKVLRSEITSRKAMELLGLKPSSYYNFVKNEKERKRNNGT